MNKHYYGTRSTAKRKLGILPVDELGVIYFSSSKDKDFMNDQKINPQDYKYKVLKIFDTRKEAIEHEIMLHNKFDVGVNESFYNKSKQTSTGFDTTGTSPKKGPMSKESSAKMVQTRLKNNSYVTGGQKISKFLKSKKWKESNRYKEIQEYYKTQEHKNTMSEARNKCNSKISETKSIIGDDGLNISQRCQLKNAKKYNIYNHKDEIIYKNLYRVEITRFHGNLFRTCKNKRFGHNNTAKVSLNYNNKLYMMGWYIMSVEGDDTLERVDFTIPKGRVYTPITEEQKEKTRITMSLKSKDEILRINAAKGAHNKGKKRSNETKLKCSLAIMGEKNYKTKVINIFNNTDKIMFVSKISFSKFCEYNNLPYNALNNSLKNENTCYSSKRGKIEAEKHNNTQYIGWYARYEKENNI